MTFQQEVTDDGTRTGHPSTMGDTQLTTTRMLAHAARSFGDQDVVHRTLDGQWHTTNYADT